MIYIHVRSNTDVFPNSITIKKFKFLDLNYESIVHMNEIVLENNAGTRITSSIIMDYNSILALFFIIYDGSRFNYYVNIYDFDLTLKWGSDIAYGFDSLPEQNGIFFKACYLYYDYIALLYFIGENSCRFSIIRLGTEENSLNERIMYTLSHTFSYIYKIVWNDFIKMDDKRFVFISTLSTEATITKPKSLVIALLDVYDWGNYLAVKYFTYNFENEKISFFTKEISAHLYNGFLAFSATALPPELNSNSDNYLSIFMIFGYANGTDSEIDIYPYLTDTDSHDSSKNLYNELIKTLKIDNNIFNYENAGQIKLVSIPEEIQFFNFENNSLIQNGSNIDANSILKQNRFMTKNNKYYYLYYQFIVKEQNFSSFYNTTDNFVGLIGPIDFSSLFEPKTFYGRTNTLKFKLCNNHCKTCKQYGPSDGDQKCETCLEESYNNIAQGNSLCIPQGYFYDPDNDSIEQCTPENSKFYIDIISNKRICFKDSLDCPQDYQDYNETSKECKYFPITKTTIVTEIATIPKTESHNEPEITQKNNNYYSTNKITETEIPTIKTKINKGNCSIEDLVENSCSNLNYTNDDITQKIDEELLIEFNASSNQSLEIKGENNSVFQLTTTDNELNRFNGKMLNTNGLSVIDLGNCETLLKIHYKINNDSSLIIKKYEQLTISAERNVQYEVYHPISKEKLNLSICDTETIDLYVPVELNEQLLELYEDLQNSGYDLFNIQDPFYNDLCSPYKSQNGTDVLLSDRKNDFYNNNYTTCQSNCEYSSFNSEYKFLKCECKVIVDDIDINHFDKFSKKIYKNFYDILKNSNYKTLKCYKLVLNPQSLKKNIGSFVVLTFFAGYLGFFAIYIFKGITPLQEEAIKTVCNKFKDVNINKLERSLTEKIFIDNKTEKQNIIEFPPKKRKSVVVESALNLENKKKKKRKSKSIEKSETIQDKRKSMMVNITPLGNNNNIFSAIKNEDVQENNNEKGKKKRRKSKSKIKFEDSNVKENSNQLDDLDLKNLTYEKALELDKRTFGQIYWSKLKSKHLIIYTFFACNDYNLIYIKISRFLFLICTSMAMNVIFFFDSSMHKIYMDYGKYNFIQQIPQIIYSSLVSLIIEILIGLLSFTDKNIYEIRQIEEFNTAKLKEILKGIKIKLIIYFVITFLFFVFYWYLISSFCAVYNNTQIIYLKDFATSFSLGLIYPFAIQLCLAFLRIFTLKQKSKARSLIYKIC